MRKFVCATMACALALLLSVMPAAEQVIRPILRIRAPAIGIIGLDLSLGPIGNSLGL